MKKNTLPADWHKYSLKQFKDELSAEFSLNCNILHLIHKLVHFIDQLLLHLFDKNGLEQTCFCLLALGSYGRRELQLHSDVDLLLLYDENLTNPNDLQKAQNFIQDCWDYGLTISHQITTIAQCAELASNDVSVISSLLDMHLLCGRGALMEELKYATHPLHIWNGLDYFFAKLAEQQQRYKKFGETAYNLEPNVKQGPGGLRDLQILTSIGKRHFGIKKLSESINYGFLTDKEYEEFINCQHYLWKVRFALHILAGKPEERLLFDYQVKLAAIFGFSDTPHSLAIEQFMKAYFKVIKRCRELNEMLLQWFSEAIVYQEKQLITPLDEQFQLSNNFIEVKNNHVFSLCPKAIIQLFLWIAKKPDIAGVKATTIRLLRNHIYLINKHFRSSPEITRCFLAIFEQDNPYEALYHMNRYGVLSHYLDCFAAVTGQMQYDLFHVYTVDQHTLFVIRNLVRFSDNQFNQPFQLAANLINRLPKKSILFLAALFHDVAKGRGGDHSELGAEEANNFAIRHQLANADRQLLVWLVKNHLLMSQTAQRQDIYDPATIKAFCEQLPEANYLDYLYLLTVADICGTNPKLWNSWKDSLLKELHQAAQRALEQQKKQLDETALINNRKLQALAILNQANIDSPQILTLWADLKNKYFLHESAEMIACHTMAILNCKQFPLVMVLPHHSQGGTEVFIYMPHNENRFIIATTVLSNNNFTIQEASVSTCNNQFDLDTYIILDDHYQTITDEKQREEIQAVLTASLSNPEQLPIAIKRRISRALAHFKFKPQITFYDDPQGRYTRLFLIASDRPGLLAKISAIFTGQQIHLHSAKIATAGERVEDAFYISNNAGVALDNEQKEQLKEALAKELV
ncbi:[protein-PII] uridylyltransferase [Legionella dresdenensis]|uniref:Bifunctional uridylyltransferase/uridylyl-removing enzyme n=1 Tax=Legionella dresdenensis TaxID=450200 RepID=A0ABV8CHC8_9GAMM